MSVESDKMILNSEVVEAGEGEGIPNGSMAAKESVAEELVGFLNGACTPFHAVHEAKVRLKQAGYVHLSERETWDLSPGGKYYFTRNQSTIVAFAVGKRYKAGNGFIAIGCHTDSPCPKLKPVSKTSKGGFLQLGVQLYGGGLWHTWFDRDLTVGGRVFVRRIKEGKEILSHELVHIPRAILRVPTLAIHLDRNVSDGFKFNNQTQFVPVLATVIKDRICRPMSASEPTCETVDKSADLKVLKNQNHHPLLLQILADELKCQPDDICNFDMDVIDTQPSAIGGALNEFIFSGRLDNLCSSFCALKGLIDATSSEDALTNEVGVRMIALFDHEEIGSKSAQGAGSPVFIDALKRITAHFTEADSTSKSVFEQAIQRSFFVSADMAHSLHPNYMDKHDERHQPQVHKGLVIKHNANQRYATNAVTALIFGEIGNRHDIPTQEFVVRNDMGCGSTIGPIVASGTGIRTVDVGTPQLSMHSIREMCGVDDVGYAYQHFKAYFEDFSEFDSQMSLDTN